MNIRNVLRIYTLERQLNADDVALLNTLRAMNDSEREALVEALSPQSTRKSSTKKSASKKLDSYVSCQRCGAPKGDTSHRDPASLNYHQFVSSSASKKSSRASSLEQQIQKRGRRAGAGDDDEGSGAVCTYEFPDSKGTRCGETVDNNVHHRLSDPLFHPFVNAASPASDPLSANGGAGSGTRSFEDGTDDASSAVHAGG